MLVTAAQAPYPDLTGATGQADHLPVDGSLETLDYLLRLLGAVACGALIGLERAFKGKPAGLRTNTLICLGSCLIMLLSIKVAGDVGLPADPGRIAAQVVTGVGFLGAGAIIRSRVSVAGLTTAATIWLVSALGLVIGYGQFVTAGISMLLLMVTLTLFDNIEKQIEVSRQLHLLRVEVAPKAIRKVRTVIDDARIVPDRVDFSTINDNVVVEIEYVSLGKKHDAFLASLREIETVKILLEY